MLLSLKVPVAMNCCVEPTDSVGVAGCHRDRHQSRWGQGARQIQLSTSHCATTSGVAPPPAISTFHYSVTSRCADRGDWSYYP